MNSTTDFLQADTCFESSRKRRWCNRRRANNDTLAQIQEREITRGSKDHTIRLQTRVLLRVRRTLVPVVVPIRARLLPVGVTECDFTLALKELDTKTLGHVPRDVAVHEPGARVVGGESNDQPAATGQEGDVAAVGVIEGET